MSAADPSDDFAKIGSSYKDVKALIDQGWATHNGVSEYIDLMIAADKQTNDNAKDFELLTQKIEGTNFSLMDFFKYDGDNNLVTDGLYDFLDSVKDVMGESYAWQDEQGGWNFDFSGDKLQDVADKFGTTVEFIKEVEKALSSSGMAVEFEDMFAEYDEFIKNSETAITKLHELSEAGEITSDVDFNLNVGTIEEVDAQIEKAIALVDELSGENGTIDINAEGAQETLSILEVLMRQKENLEGATVMDIELDNVDLESDIGKAVSLMQELKNAYAHLEVQQTVGLDTTGAEAELDAILEKMSGNKSITGKLQIDTSSYESAIASINSLSPTILVNAGLNSSAVDGYDPNDIDKTVRFNKESTVVDNYMNKLSTTVTNHTVRMNYVKAGSGIGIAEGTAHAQGTAMRKGDWGTRMAALLLAENSARRWSCATGDSLP